MTGCPVIWGQPNRNIFEITVGSSIRTYGIHRLKQTDAKIEPLQHISKIGYEVENKIEIWRYIMDSLG